jgi:hypothetical protein
VMWEELLHNWINFHSFVDFLLESLIIFKRWIFENSVVKHMKIGISWVNSELILS